MTGISHATLLFVGAVLSVWIIVSTITHIVTEYRLKQLKAQQEASIKITQELIMSSIQAMSQRIKELENPATQEQDRPSKIAM